MKKMMILAGMLSIGYVSAQEHDGKVGINIAEPKATLEVESYKNDGTTKEGILIPRLAKQVVVRMKALNPEESTLVYVTDEVATADAADFVGTGKGFYFYDTATSKWTKLGAGESAATAEIDMNKATGKVQSLPVPITADQIQSDTFLLIANQGGTPRIITLPAPPQDGEGIRLLSVNNQAGGDITFQGAYQPKNMSKLVAGAGHLLIGYNNVWYIGGGLY